ncbi:MAG: putative hydrolases or acyltransferases (alpha/beta hydrolase superfamily) [Phormidesmis priestleyi Ana]|uniref:Putative hydrolases or acyltransferases (Alpha/beta hydrolase superfamily) n=1 Tax=Phormidesmis priestleyi Ana TaxID=1666911 RepID=A0A0P7Z060_9CYAN|nr:MAG: putative hydrolases or acyltransferases (alpha/beta hydrolase superfamily) [Phormidesmis priestleyi Ana]
MLFLHGFPEFWYSWRHQISEFSKDYKVVAVDLRGYNESEKPHAKSAYAISELIEDVAGVITGLGYEKCVLVGHDWGGAIAWSFAYTYPQMLKQLIVLNLPHPAKFAEGLRTPQQILRSWYIGLFQLPMVPELLLSANHYAAIRSLFTNTAVNPHTFTSADLDALVAAAAKPNALTSMLNYYRNLRQPDSLLNRHWDVLQVPTLMVWGENDAALSKELTYGTEALVADFRIHYIPQCSHWVQQEQPALVNQYIRDFLS